MYSVFVKALLTVLLPTTAVCFVVYHGFFDDIFTEVGEKHYAEKSYSTFKAIFPRWMKMPLNTIVNFGYVVVGAYWLAVTSVALKNKTVSEIDGHIFYVFNFMAVVYGPIQALRIITQQHRFAVLDQWYTLPFFMWVFLWGMYLKSKWSVFRAFIWMTWSICAYSMSLYHKHGFEVILSFHIFLAVLGAAFAYQKYPTSKCVYPFVMAMFSCIGFVVLKLADHQLPTYNPVFYTISGHFLSKICDILQIHYVNLYFQSIIGYRTIEETKKKS